MTKAISTTALQFIKQGWTQQTFARNTLGVKVDFNSGEAVCWCSIGAIAAAYGYGPENYRANKRLEEVVGMNIASWNDKPGRTKEEVVEAFMNAGI